MALSSVFLVEDDPDSRASLARGLERAGYACATAASYDEAITVSGKGTFVACIVDIVLGDDETAGLRLIPHLRSLPGRPPVVVITAFADVAKVKYALNAGAAYLLEKPFRTNDLIDVLRRLGTDPGEFSRYVDFAITQAKLTEREGAVARLVLKGLTSAEIARVEGTADKTVRATITQIYAKCGVTTRAELFHFVFPS
jgi:DNA-binding NarL/FixJ family response regulator